MQGGRGADSTLTNAVNAIVGAGGDIYLTQTVAAGSGGEGDYGVGSVGGAASSSLTFDDTAYATQAADIYATVEADAGCDGAGTMAAPSGGAATATGSFTGAGDLYMKVFANCALGPNVPHCDLYVSPDHALYLAASLIPAQLLLNGRTITQPERTGSVDYYHLEVAPHDPIIAEGAAAKPMSTSAMAATSQPPGRRRAVAARSRRPGRMPARRRSWPGRA